MKICRLLILAFGLSCFAQAAPLKVAVLPGADGLRGMISESGAHIVDGVALDTAEVIVIAGAIADRAAVEAAAKRGAGIVVVGHGIEAGDWLKPLVGAAWTSAEPEILEPDDALPAH